MTNSGKRREWEVGVLERNFSVTTRILTPRSFPYIRHVIITDDIEFRIYNFCGG